MTHTPTPWEWDAGDVGQQYSVPYCDVYVDGGNLVIAGVNENIEQGRPNAARIVACVNFFHGRDIPTERIAEGGFWEMVAALDEIAYGAPWGGPASDHVKFMRGVAEKVLTKMGFDA